MPDFDPDFGDRALTEARHDIVIGRWQGVRDLLAATGDAWARRTHRIRLLSHAAAGSSTVETWWAAEPGNPDAAVLRAATEVVRVFDAAIAAGRGAAVDRGRIDAAVDACRGAAGAAPADPMPWVSLLSVARLYEGGVPRRELRHWFDELRRRDPYNTEGTSRCCGTGRRGGTARTAACTTSPATRRAWRRPAPRCRSWCRWPGSRSTATSRTGPWAGARCAASTSTGSTELAVTELRRTHARWIGGRDPGSPVAPEEVGDLNFLVHAACYAGQVDIARELLGMLGRRAAWVPWAYTGDPEEQFTRFREGLGVE